MSRLLEIITGPWAILPDKLEEIRAIYETRMRGERIDVQAVEASIGRPLANEQQDYEIVDGVAVIPVGASSLAAQTSSPASRAVRRAT